MQGKVRQVKSDEGQHDQTRESHGAGEDRRFDRRIHRVFLGTGGLIFLPNQHGEADVQYHRRQQGQPDDPEQRPEGVQFEGIGVNQIRPEKNRQVPQKVADDKRDENDSCDRHNQLLS